MKLTHWINGSIKPVRVGVYQRNLSAHPDFHPNKNILFAKWDGQKWCISKLSTYSAELEYDASLYQNLFWRGLAEQPK